MNDSPDFVTGGLKLLQLGEIAKRIRFPGMFGNSEADVLADMRAFAVLHPECQQYVSEYGTAYAPHEPMAFSEAERLVRDLGTWSDVIASKQKPEAETVEGIAEFYATTYYPDGIDVRLQAIRSELRSWIASAGDSPTQCQAALDAASEAAGFQGHGISFGGWSEPPVKRHSGQSDAPRTITAKRGRPKRGESDAESRIIAALNTLHEYEAPSQFLGKQEAFSTKEIATRAEVSKGTVSKFFQRQFSNGWNGYRAACISRSVVTQFLVWNNESIDRMARVHENDSLVR